MNNVLEKITKARREEEIRRAEREKQESLREEFDLLSEKFNQNVLPNLRKAEAYQYEEWLQAYLSTDEGEITHVYNYDLPSRFYVARNSFHLSALYGALAVSIIVPKGITVSYGELGHNNLYLMEGPANVGDWAPLYDDMFKDTFN